MIGPLNTHGWIFHLSTGDSDYRLSSFDRLDKQTVVSNRLRWRDGCGGVGWRWFGNLTTESEMVRGSSGRHVFGGDIRLEPDSLYSFQCYRVGASLKIGQRGMQETDFIT